MVGIILDDFSEFLYVLILVGGIFQVKSVRVIDVESNRVIRYRYLDLVFVLDVCRVFCIIGEYLNFFFFIFVIVIEICLCYIMVYFILIVVCSKVIKLEMK